MDVPSTLLLRILPRTATSIEQGEHYGVPGLLVDGLNADDVAKGGKAVIDYIRQGKGPAILQVHTYRFNGHSPADPEHERGRKDEKAWARAEQDPIKTFEDKYISNGVFTEDELKDARKSVLADVKEAVKFADSSPMPPVELAKELEYPDAADTDYNLKQAPEWADDVNARTIAPEAMENVQAHIAALREKAKRVKSPLVMPSTLPFTKKCFATLPPLFMLRIFRLVHPTIFPSSLSKRMERFVPRMKLLTKDTLSERLLVRP